jgi:hypothetical protein
LRLWLAWRLYDYRHLRDRRGPGARVGAGRRSGRSRRSDIEPRVRGVRPMAWVSDDVLAESVNWVARQPYGEWGSLDRAR